LLEPCCRVPPHRKPRNNRPPSPFRGTGSPSLSSRRRLGCLVIITCCGFHVSVVEMPGCWECCKTKVGRRGACAGLGLHVLVVRVARTHPQGTDDALSSLGGQEQFLRAERPSPGKSKRHLLLGVRKWVEWAWHWKTRPSLPRQAREECQRVHHAQFCE